MVVTMDLERGLKPAETQRALQALWGGRSSKRAVQDVQNARLSSNRGDQTMDATELHALVQVRLLRTIFLVFVLELPDMYLLVLIF